MFATYALPQFVVQDEHSPVDESLSPQRLARNMRQKSSRRILRLSGSTYGDHGLDGSINMPNSIERSDAEADPSLRISA